MTSREEIEQGFVDAGWELDGSFSAYLAVGEDGHLAILASQQVWETGEPAFELYDWAGEVAYRVKEIPTPHEAAKLLEEHGVSPEEE